MEEIYFDKEGRDKLINGVNKLNRAVSSTMGPNGKNVIIPDNNLSLTSLLNVISSIIFIFLYLT